MSTSTLKPAEVAVAMVDMAIVKHNTRLDRMFFKAFMAGIMLSFGGLCSSVVAGGSPGLAESNPGLVKLLSGMVFPIGLIMVILQGFELVTSNMMILPIGLMKRSIPWWSLIVNWIVVTFGNLTGSLFFAAILVHYSGIMSADPYKSYLISAAAKKVALNWREVFLRGIGCNWLVGVAVWQAAGAKETISKVIAIWLPILVFVACSYEHVVANMFTIPVGIMMGAEITVAEYIRKSMIASYLGNIVGALLVAVPATYFYLSDFPERLRAAEEGQIASAPSTEGSLKSNEEIKRTD